MKEELANRLREGKIAQLIEDDEVEAGHVIGQSALLATVGVCLKAIHKVDHIVEPTAGAVADERTGDGDGKVGFAGACPADQDDIALIGHEVDGRVSDLLCIFDLVHAS